MLLASATHQPQCRAICASPDGSRIAYLADQDTDDIIELYASLPDGEENTNLSGELVTGGDVVQFEWVP